MKLNIYVLGNDKRQIFAAEFLNATHIINPEEAIKLKTGCLVLPTPVSKDGIHISDTDINLDVLKYISADLVIFGGIIPEKLKQYLNNNGNKWYDYYEDESLTIKNAVATAEATLSVIISETDFSLFNSKCLVAGYGRIGKVLCNYLKALGAAVTTTSRSKSERTFANVNGINAVSTYEIEKHISGFQIVINTAPFMIFTPQVIDNLTKGALLVDLASKPGGADFEFFNTKFNII